MWLSILTLAASLVFVTAPVAHADADTQYWSSIMLRKGLGDSPWWLGTEWTYRHSVEKNRPVTNSIRLWSGYKLPVGTDINVGYEFRETNVWANDERRLLIQGVHRWNFESLALQLRLRQEVRRFNNNSDNQYRSRIQGRVEATSWTYWQSTPFFSGEWFYIHNDVGSRKAGSQEARAVVGLSVNPTDAVKIDVGYINR